MLIRRVRLKYWPQANKSGYHEYCLQVNNYVWRHCVYDIFCFSKILWFFNSSQNRFSSIIIRMRRATQVFICCVHGIRICYMCVKFHSEFLKLVVQLLLSLIIRRCGWWWVGLSSSVRYSLRCRKREIQRGNAKNWHDWMRSRHFIPPSAMCRCIR